MFDELKRFGLLQIGGESENAFRVLFEEAGGSVASATKEASDLAGIVVVIDAEFAVAI